MKNLSIFEPQIEKHYAYKKKHVSKNIQKSKFHYLTHAWGEEVSKVFQNEEILKLLPPRLLKSLT